MNAIELLKADHDKMDLLFQKVKAENGDMQKLFEQIKEELEIHAHIEEAVFYPKLKEKEELKDIVLEGVEEHHQAKIFLREISALTEDSEKFEPKLKVLIEDVEHHVMEEEGEMFRKVEELFDEAQLEELGKQLEAEKRNYKKAMTTNA